MQTIETLTGRQAALPIDSIQSQLSFLRGRMLTIADASFSDKDQRKAVKDLMRAAFSSQANHFNDLAFGREGCAAGQETGDQDGAFASAEE